MGICEFSQSFANYNAYYVCAPLYSAWAEA